MRGRTACGPRPRSAERTRSAASARAAANPASVAPSRAATSRSDATSRPNASARPELRHGNASTTCSVPAPDRVRSARRLTPVSWTRPRAAALTTRSRNACRTAVPGSPGRARVRPHRRATARARCSGRSATAPTSRVTLQAARGKYRFGPSRRRTSTRLPRSCVTVVPGRSGAHGVHAAVDVHDLAGGGREPVRQQRRAGAGGGLGVVDVPAERGALGPTCSRTTSKPGIDLAAVVRIGPAATRLTRMPSGPRSRAR